MIDSELIRKESGPNYYYSLENKELNGCSDADATGIWATKSQPSIWYVYVKGNLTYIDKVKELTEQEAKNWLLRGDITKGPEGPTVRKTLKDSELKKQDCGNTQYISEDNTALISGNSSVYSAWAYKDSNEWNLYASNNPIHVSRAYSEQEAKNWVLRHDKLLGPESIAEVAVEVKAEELIEYKVSTCNVLAEKNKRIRNCYEFNVRSAWSSSGGVWILYNRNGTQEVKNGVSFTKENALNWVANGTTDIAEPTTVTPEVKSAIRRNKSSQDLRRKSSHRFAGYQYFAENNVSVGKQGSNVKFRTAWKHKNSAFWLLKQNGQVLISQQDSTNLTDEQVKHWVKTGTLNKEVAMLEDKKPEVMIRELDSGGAFYKYMAQGDAVIASSSSPYRSAWLVPKATVWKIYDEKGALRNSSVTEQEAINWIARANINYGPTVATAPTAPSVASTASEIPKVVIEPVIKESLFGNKYLAENNKDISSQVAGIRNAWRNSLGNWNLYNENAHNVADNVPRAEAFNYVARGDRFVGPTPVAPKLTIEQLVEQNIFGWKVYAEENKKIADANDPARSAWRLSGKFILYQHGKVIMESCTGEEARKWVMDGSLRPVKVNSKDLTIQKQHNYWVAMTENNKKITSPSDACRSAWKHDTSSGAVWDIYQLGVLKKMRLTEDEARRWVADGIMPSPMPEAAKTIPAPVELPKAPIKIAIKVDIPTTKKTKSAAIDKESDLIIRVGTVGWHTLAEHNQIISSSDVACRSAWKREKDNCFQLWQNGKIQRTGVSESEARRWIISGKFIADKPKAEAQEVVAPADDAGASHSGAIEWGLAGAALLAAGLLGLSQTKTKKLVKQSHVEKEKEEVVGVER